MGKIEEKEKTIFKQGAEHVGQSIWMVLVLLLGLGVTSLIDTRIHNHPDIIEIKRELALEAIEVRTMSKTLLQLEVHMANTEKTMDSIWKVMSRSKSGSPSTP